MNKLSWAVTAGDQDPDSEDDQPCGDHFIDKDLECHDGDAHRPTPGNNPYWQGERKGPEDKSRTPSRKEGEKNQPGHERDRSEHTQQNRERMELLLDQGHTPESLGRDNVNHFADMMEENYGRPLTDKDVHTLVDMVNQKMGESFSQDPEQKGIHDPTAPKGFKGPKGREMSRPTRYHKETTDKEYTPSDRGGPEEGGLYDHYKNILKDRVSDGGGEDAPKKSNVPEGWDEGPWIDNSAAKPKKEEGPSQEMKDEQDKWDGSGYRGDEDAGPEPKTKKGEVGPYEFQERQVDEWEPGESAEESKPYRKNERTRQVKKDYKRKRDAGKAKVPKAKKPAKNKEAKKSESALAYQLTWGKIVQDRVDDDLERKRHSRHGDEAQARPCEDGEDPKIGKCNPRTSTDTPAAPPGGGGKPGQRPEGPAGPTDPGYRVSDRLKGPTQEGIGLQPRQDASRGARMAQHVDFLSQDNGMDTKQTTNLLSKMMGGKPIAQPDGTSMVGSKPVATPQEAKQQNDDYRDTLTKTGWETHSEMGNKAVYKKGNTAIVLEKKNNGNQMKIKNLRPAAPPKQRGRR